MMGIAKPHADVIEIRSDGVAVTYARPAMWSPDGVRPIEPANPPRRHFDSASHSKPQIAAALGAAARRHRIDEQFLDVVAWQESHWNADSVSASGARGLMQLMPATAAALRVDTGDPAANADGGAAYLAQLLRHFDGDLIRALAAYNAGPAAVERYNGVPPYPETRKYIGAILDHLADISLMQSSSGASP